MWASSNTSANQFSTSNEAGNQSSSLGIDHGTTSTFYDNGSHLNQSNQDASATHDNDSEYYGAGQHLSNAERRDVMSTIERNGASVVGNYYYNHSNTLPTTAQAQQYFFNGGLNFDYNSFITEPNEAYEQGQVGGSGNSGSATSFSSMASASLRHFGPTDGPEQGQTFGQNQQELSHVHQLSYHGLYYNPSNSHLSSNYHLYSQMNGTTIKQATANAENDQDQQMCSNKMKEIANRLALSTSASNGSEGVALTINPNFIQNPSYSTGQALSLLCSSTSGQQTCHEATSTYNDNITTPSKPVKPNSSIGHESSHKNYSGNSSF